MLVAYHTFVPGETSFRAGGAALLRMAFDVFYISGLPPGVMLHDIHARVPFSRFALVGLCMSTGDKLLARAPSVAVCRGRHSNPGRLLHWVVYFVLASGSKGRSSVFNMLCCAYGLGQSLGILTSALGRYMYMYTLAL